MATSEQALPAAPEAVAASRPAPPLAEHAPEPSPSHTDLIDPAVLEAAQQSIVGLVIVWSEHEDPFAWLTEPPSPEGAAAGPEMPVISICTGWFATPTTIATAGHCVDPEEGRVAMHMQGDGIDPETGLPRPIDYTRPAPTATVYAFQPRELPGAVLTSPVIVRVHSFRKAEDGDTAKLEVHGMPPGKPLPIASTTPRLGEAVTSIGFPGLNISETDGINMEKLLEGGEQTPAAVLQDSRLHPVNTSGTIMSRQFRKGVAVYQVNADFAGGLSGGPTVNARGEVYGINSMMAVTLFSGGNFNVITDTGMLREFLFGPTGTDAADTPAPGFDVVPPPAAAAAESSAVRPVEDAGQVEAQAARTDTSGVGPVIGWVGAGGLIGGVILGSIAGTRYQRSRTQRGAPSTEPDGAGAADGGADAAAPEATPRPVPAQP